MNYVDKKDLPNLAKAFFIDQGLELKSSDENSNILFAVVGQFVWQDTTLNKNEIRTLLFLNHISREFGYTWVGQETIAKELGISRKTVNKIIPTLEDKRYIRTKQVKQANNLYNNLTVLTYSPKLKVQYKSSLDKVKPAQNRSSSRAKTGHQAGPKRLQDEGKVMKERVLSKGTTTTNSFKEGLNPIEATRRNTTAYDDILIEYRKHIDSLYILQKADKNAIDTFEFVSELVEYIKYWLKFIGAEEGYESNGNRLNSFEVKHTAKIWVIISKWNEFKDFADRKINKNRQSKLNAMFFQIEKETSDNWCKYLELYGVEFIDDYCIEIGRAIKIDTERIKKLVERESGYIKEKPIITSLAIKQVILLLEFGFEYFEDSDLYTISFNISKQVLKNRDKEALLSMFEDDDTDIIPQQDILEYFSLEK
jgi:hypothetical protein